MNKQITNLIMKMAAIMLVFISSNAMALDLSLEIDKVNQSDNFIVKVHNKNEKDFTISIVNSSDKVIFKEAIRYAERFKKVYNLSSLPKGDYSLIVNTDSQRIEKVIVINGINKSHPEIGKNILVGFSSLSKDKHVGGLYKTKRKKPFYCMLSTIKTR